MIGLSKLFVKFINFMKFTYIMQLNNVILKRIQNRNFSVRSRNDGLLIEHVTKKFGDFTAVNDISLRLDKGKMLGFLGRNGAGKTTTFRMILGLSETTTGHITYEGKILTNICITKLAICQKSVAYIPK